MKKVRRIKCNANLDSLFQKDRIFIEYGTFPGFFYPEEDSTPSGVGAGEEFLKKMKIDHHFEELEPVPFNTTAWYNIAKEELEMEIENAELGLQIAKQKYCDLLEQTKIFEE